MASLLFELTMLSEFLMMPLKGNKKAAALHSATACAHSPHRSATSSTHTHYAYYCTGCAAVMRALTTVTSKWSDMQTTDLFLSFHQSTTKEIPYYYNMLLFVCNRGAAQKAI